MYQAMPGFQWENLRDLNLLKSVHTFAPVCNRGGLVTACLSLPGAATEASDKGDTRYGNNCKVGDRPCCCVTGWQRQTCKME